MPAGSHERSEVHYQGRVQGVGFRYTVVRIAGRYEVTGYVQNLPDGRVKLVAEGAADQRKQLLRDVAATMEGYIQQAALDEKPATGEFSEFTVRH